VDTHSYKLSPLGPALQFGGGSNVISASSFCIRLADVPSAFEILGLVFVSFASGLGATSTADEELVLLVLPPLPVLAVPFVLAPPLLRPPPPAPLLAELELALEDILFGFVKLSGKNVFFSSKNYTERWKEKKKKLKSSISFVVFGKHKLSSRKSKKDKDNFQKFNWLLHFQVFKLVLCKSFTLSS
jgi:hypothetical protein